MSTTKTLYHATGRYKYFNQWNDIPKECQYFYAFPGRQKMTLKGLISRHRKLARTQYMNVKLGTSVKIVEVTPLQTTTDGILVNKESEVKDE